MLAVAHLAVVEQELVGVGLELVEFRTVVAAAFVVDLVGVASVVALEPEERSVAAVQVVGFVAVEIPLAVVLVRLVRGDAEQGSGELPYCFAFAAAEIRTGSLPDPVAAVAYFASAFVGVELAGLEALIGTELCFAWEPVAGRDSGIATEAIVELLILGRVLVEHLVEVEVGLVEPFVAVDGYLEQNSVARCSY